MNRPIWEKWLFYHCFSTFFYDFPVWLEKAPMPYYPTGGDGYPVNLESAADPELMREYDDLFKGVHADITIPLWASACKGVGNILLDHTTLDVVLFYKKWGYAPIEMDGNPPDFIGQMFSFLEYLSTCMLRESDKGLDIREYEEAEESFVNLYLLDTAKVVAEGIKLNCISGVFRNVADNILDFLSGDCQMWEGQKFDETLLRDSQFYNVYRNGRLPEIPRGEKVTINTAGRNNCGGKCVIRATVCDGCVLDLDADCGEQTPQIRACVRGRSYRRTFLSGKRLRYPMKRIGERGEGRFRRITWEEAADTIADEWVRIRDTYGPGARYVNYSTGVSAVMRPDNMVKRLLNLDGGCLDYYNDYSDACSRYITPYIYGDENSENGIEDILNTRLLILWGHNPSETIFGSERNYYTARAKDKGVRIIVIDPRYSDTAVALADEWIGIKPSTDGALADAMAYVIWSEGLYHRRFMDTYCLGFDEAHMPDGIPPNHSYEAYLFGWQDNIPKTPLWAEAITGVPAETIARLAREYATTKPACLMPGLGVQRVGNGEQTVRGIALLACLTGNVGIPGGGAAGLGVVREHASPSLPVLKNPFNGIIPSFLWTTAVENAMGMTKREHGLEGVQRLDANIKLIFNFAGNALINQHSDINNTIRILKDTRKCEFIVCSDVFMTPSARFADILLPATSFLESENITEPWSFGSYLLYNNKVIEPLFGCKFEYDPIREIAARLGLLEKWEQGRQGVEVWLKVIYEDLRGKEPQLPEFDVFRCKGGYRYTDTRPYIAFEEQIKDFTNHPFATPSGKIEIFSERLFHMDNPEEIPAIPRYVACPEGPNDELAEKYPLQLIGWHTKRRTHSIHDNNEWMEELEPQRVWMNPEDAAKRGIKTEESVEIFNDRGRIRMPAHITDRVIKGVVAIPQGAWYTPDKDGVDIRGSINVLTSTRPTPIAKGNPQHTNLVEITRVTESPCQ